MGVRLPNISNPIQLHYCLLFPVYTGSGLNKAPGFVEFTNEWLCLGFGLSACK